MATTKIWPIKRQLGYVLNYIKNEEKTEPANQTDSLDSVLDYVGKGEKTDAQRFVTGINCAPDTAWEDMTAEKRRFGKTDGTMAFHAYQSFAPGEVTPEQAHQIGVQLANELWGDRFQVVVATHLDKETHIHNHFVINSVSFVYGKRFHSDAKFLHRMREVSDRLCRENGLSVVQNPNRGKTKHYAEYKAEQEGRPTWRTTIKADIDRALAASMTDRQFFDTLRRMGYDYKIGQDISVRPPGKERYFRLARNLGDDYTLENIRRRLGLTIPQKRQTPPQNESPPLPVRRHYRLKGTLPRRRKSHLRRMYLYYCYRLGVFKKHPQSIAKMHFLLREDLKNLNKYTEEIKLLHTYHIDTDVQLLSFRSEKQTQMDSLTAQREKLRNRLRHMTDETQAETVRQEIYALSKQITQARKEVRLCDDILSRSSEIARKLEIIRRDETELRQEEERYGYQRTGR